MGSILDCGRLAGFDFEGGGGTGAKQGSPKRAAKARHERGRWKNNRAENSHQPTPRRKRKMQRFKTPGSAQKFLSTHAAVYNTFDVQRHLASAQTHRVLRAAAMDTWQTAVGAV
jgi:transposase-like protein